MDSELLTSTCGPIFSDPKDTKTVGVTHKEKIDHI